MDNNFKLDLVYNEIAYHFSAELIPSAYSYRIAVDVFDTIIQFEPDEEGNFRALVNPEDLSKAGTINKDLLEAISHKLAMHFNS